MKKYLYLLLVGTLALAACGSDDDDDNSAEQTSTATGISKSGDTYMLKRKTGYGNDWIYVNLAKMDTVHVDEDSHATNTDWDLAFNRYNVRTNGGKSGVGEGGAYLTSKSSWNSVSAADIPDDSQFTADSTAEITASLDFSSDFSMTTVESSYNYVLATALQFSGPPPAYTPNANVFIIKSADGTYYKFKAIGFYDEEGNSGFYNFGCVKLK